MQVCDAIENCDRGPCLGIGGVGGEIVGGGEDDVRVVVPDEDLLDERVFPEVGDNRFDAFFAFPGENDCSDRDVF